MGWFDFFSGIPTNAVLRERVALAEEKCKASTAESAALRSKNEALSSENQRLKMNIAKLQQQIRCLQSNSIALHNQRLQSDQEKVLLLFAKESGIGEGYVADALNIGSQLAAFHIDELLALKYIARIYNRHEKWATFELAQAGRKYLAAHGLLT